MHKPPKLLTAFFMAIAFTFVQQIFLTGEMAQAKDGINKFTTGSTRVLLARRDRRPRHAIEETQPAEGSSSDYSGESSASSQDSSYGSSDSSYGASDSSQSDSSVSSSGTSSEPSGEPHTLLYYVIQYVGILLGGTLLIALLSSSSFLFLGLCWQIAKMMNGGKKPEIG